MKFKLKYLVAALGLVASVPSFATIADPTTPAGGGELFLVVWEQGVVGKTDQSFTLDTGITYANFLAGASSSQTLADILSTDTTFQAFLASSSLSDLQYAVIGGTTVLSPVTLLTTVHAGDEAQVALGTNNQITGALNQLPTFLNAVNTTGTHPGGVAVNGESSNPTGSSAYFMDVNNPLQYFNLAFGGTFSNSNLIGVSSEFTTLAKVAGFGTKPGNEVVLPGIVNFAQVGNDYVLSYTVAAVPEPTGLGMALAGLGMLGFIGLRRKQG